MISMPAPRFEVDDRVYYVKGGENYPATVVYANNFLGERLYQIACDDPAECPVHLVTGNVLMADVMGWVEFETDIEQITPRMTDGTICRFCWSIIPRTGKPGRPATICAECKENGVHN